MEMIRWLLGNRIVQVAWGLGILAVLLAWLFGGSKADHDTVEVDSSAKTEQVVEAVVSTKEAGSSVVAEVKQEAETALVDTKTAVAAGTAAVVATAVATTQAVADTSEAAVEAVKEVVAPAETSEQMAATEVKAASETVKEVVTSTADATEQAVTSEVAATTDVVETKSEEVEVEAVDASTEDAEVVILTAGLAEKSSEDLLMMAREAYWNNGLDEAAELYTALIEREPTVIEHKGELGNVFWRQGFPKKAAELYADIAEPMIEKGNGERVSNMVGFIGLFFPERAANIRKLLDK